MSNLQYKIEYIRNQLYEYIDLYGINHGKTLKKSHELDELIILETRSNVLKREGVVYE